MIGAVAAIGSLAAVGASLRWNWWRPKVSSGIPTLMYHKFGDHPKGSQLAKLWVTTSDFRRQMEYLKSHGFTTLTFTELRDIEHGRAPRPEKPCLVTVDDGYENNYTIAYPIMKELGLKINIFLVYETIDSYNSWHNPESEPWIPMMNWKQVREMQDSGVVEFGSHTMRHRNLPTIALDDVRWELEESKKRIEEKLGRELVGFAYPYGAGAYHPEVRKLARAAGYHYDFGIKQGITPWPWKPEHGPIKRLFIRGDDTMLDFHLQMTRGKAYF